MNKQINTTNNDTEFSNFAMNIESTGKSKKIKKSKRSMSKFVNKTNNTNNTNKINLLNDTINNLSLSNDKKGIIYTRCSTVKQLNDNNTSLETQLAICLDYCSTNKISVIDIRKDIIPGHDINKLNLNDIPNNFTNINIIFADPSRLSRNVSDADTFLKNCAEKNIILHFARDNLTSNILHDRRNIIGLIHDAYTETQIMSKRIKTSIEVRKRKGSFIGNPQFGNKIVKLSNEMIPFSIRKSIEDNNEQQIIEIIKGLYYGTNELKFVEQLIKTLGSDSNYKLKWNDEKTINNIYYGNITMSSIVDCLNENNIFKRGKEWTIYSLQTVINNLNIKDNEINYEPKYK
jgi:DNA invertase Pin-like site-specific DNA recombinase